MTIVSQNCAKYSALFLVCTVFLATCLLLFKPTQSEKYEENEEQIQEDIRIRIRVMTYNRKIFLYKLLQSLKNAEYGADGENRTVDLEISIDYDKVKGINESVAEVAERFEWPFGRKVIIEHTQNVGVIGQWIEGWYPTNMNEFVFFIEDDIEVSPHYYRWIKTAIKKYNRPDDRRYKRIFSVTLHKLNTIPAINAPKGKLPIQNDNKVFAFPVLGTWGTVFFPKPWLLFRKWYRSKKRQIDYKPIVNGIINSKWYSHSPSTVWSQWAIKWADETGRFCLYTNFPAGTCLATNYRPPGNHFKHHRARPDCNLVETITPDLNFDVWPADLLYLTNAALPLDIYSLPSNISDENSGSE